jgi:hypothetical protein
MSEALAHKSAHVNRSSLFSLLFGATGAAILVALPLPGCILAASAIALSLTARREFKATSARSGARLAAGGLLLGVGVLIVGLVPTIGSLVIAVSTGLS